MASDLYMNFLWAFEEIGKDLNKGEEYFEKLYSYIPKDELDEYKHQFLAEDLNEALEDYKLIYYLSTATAERRPETIEDVENDWKEESFAADSDLDACKYAYEKIQLSYMDDFDFNTVADFVEYCEEKDLGDGSAFVVKLEGPNGVIYDMGQTKDDFIEQVKENDEMLSYYRKVLGIDESLNEGNLDILNTEKDDNKMNEDMSVRAKLKALYPELNFGDDVEEAINESVDPDMFAELQEYAEDYDGYDLISYDSDYSDYISDLYNTATDKLESEFKNLFIEPSIQGTAGSVFAWYEKDGQKYEAEWNFEDECEFLDEIILSSTSEKNYINKIMNYLRKKLNAASLQEDFDDNTEFDINESHETRLMSSLYEGSDDFDDYDDDAEWWE